MTEPVREQAQDNLVALKAHLRDLERQVGEAREAYNAALIDAFPVREGDEVDGRFWSNEEFRPIIVRRLTVRYGTVRVTASTQNKGGDYSKAIREVDALRLRDGTVLRVR